MESTGSESPVVVTKQDQDIEAEDRGVSRADLQRAHARVAVRLGDVVCEGRDTISTIESAEIV